MGELYLYYSCMYLFTSIYYLPVYVLVVLLEGSSSNNWIVFWDRGLLDGYASLMSLQVSLAFLVQLGHVISCLEACLAGGWCVPLILPHARTWASSCTTMSTEGLLPVTPPVHLNTIHICVLIDAEKQLESNITPVQLLSGQHKFPCSGGEDTHCENYAIVPLIFLYLPYLLQDLLS